MERNKLHKTKKRSSIVSWEIVYGMYIYLIVWKNSALHIRLLYFIGEKITQKMCKFLWFRNKLVRHSTVICHCGQAGKQASDHIVEPR
jgi:hypothetical protein